MPRCSLYVSPPPYRELREASGTRAFQTFRPKLPIERLDIGIVPQLPINDPNWWEHVATAIHQSNSGNFIAAGAETY